MPRRTASDADILRLRHMVDAARQALAYCRGRSRTDLDDTPMLRDAVVRQIEIVGEAAVHVSSQNAALLPAVPWPAIRGMRNRIVHEYSEIDLDVVWAVVTGDLPPLIEALERHLAPSS